jgi:hypothetical protein
MICAGKLSWQLCLLRAVYEIQSIGKDGQEHWFHKPWVSATARSMPQLKISTLLA